MDKIADELYDWGININLTGGEPFLREDIFEIMLYLEQTDNVVSYNVITNGVAIRREDMERMNLLEKLIEVKLSIEHSDAEINDRIRGKGSFAKLMEKYNLLRELCRKKLVFMYTLAEYNYKDIVSENRMGLLDFAAVKGADAVILERFVPLGRGKELKQSCLDEVQWEAVIKAVVDYAGLEMEVDELKDYRAFYIELGDTIEVKGALCNLGEMTMALMPNGDIYPCRRLPIKIGNIFTDRIIDLMPKIDLLKDKQGCTALRHSLQKLE